METYYRLYPHLRSLVGLPRQHKVVFAASCAERLVPNYRAFYLTEKWGNLNALESGISFVWENVLQKDIDKSAIEVLAEACQQAAPDSETFTTAFTGAAIDAAGTVYYSLKALQSNDPKYAIQAGVASFNAIENYLFIVNYPGFNRLKTEESLHEWLAEAPLRMTEEQAQKETIAQLQQHMVLNDTILQSHRIAARHSGIQPFERGLVKETMMNPTN